MTAAGALAGIRVLDLSRVLAGPSVTQMLADFGAEVIKVERPVQGDESRFQGVLPTPREGLNRIDSSGFTAVNRGKKSIAIDMASPDGQELVRDLARTSDIVVENFKTGGLRRYGLDYESLRTVNPKLVYCSITGFGQTGPNSKLPGYDLIFQAMTGVIASISNSSGDGKPQRVGFPVSDITAGMTATIAVLAALFHVKAGGGEGQHIDVSLFDAQLAAMTVTAAGYLIANEVPELTGCDSNVAAPYQAFDCADGRLVVTVNNEGQFAGMCRALGFPEVANDPRYASNAQRMQNRDTLIPLLSDAMKKLPVQVCMETFSAHGVPCGQINDVGQALESEQARRREMTRVIEHPVKGGTRVVSNPIKFSGTPVQYTLAPPLLAEHTDEILTTILELAPERIEALAASGVIGLPSPTIRTSEEVHQEES